MFQHDLATNRLWLRPGQHAPWLRLLCKSKKDLGKTWLFCIECKERFVDGQKHDRGHIPFRDRASQALMKTPQKQEPKSYSY